MEKASNAAPGAFEKGVYDYKDLLAQLQDQRSSWGVTASSRHCRQWRKRCTLAESVRIREARP
jgi:hypothetical protein